MRGFVGRINHRDAVLAHLGALLLCYPPKRQFADDFPELKSRMRSDFEAGVTASSSALQIAEAIVGSFVGQLDATEKAAVLGGLVDTGRRGFAEIAERRVKGAREPAGGNVLFVTRLAGVALFMAGRMSEEGSVGRHAYAEFVARLALLLGADASGVDALEAAFRLS